MTPESPQLSEVALEAMRRTIKSQYLLGSDHAATIDDLQSDPEWSALFDEGYVYVGNMDTGMLDKITNGATPESDEEVFYSRCWYMQPNVSRKTATAYEYGNPNRPKLTYPSVALFAKK